MQLSRKTRTIVTNLLIALGISLIVNIADILFVLRTSTEITRITVSENTPMDTLVVQGRTYIVPVNRFGRMRRDSLRNDTLRPSAVSDGATAVNDSLKKSQQSVNQQEKSDSNILKHGQDIGNNTNKVFIRRPSHIAYAVSKSAHYQTKQLIYFFVLSFILISAAIYKPKKRSTSGYAMRLVVCLALTVIAYFFAPNVAANGYVVPTMKFPGREMYDTILLLKCSLAFIVAALYGKIYDLSSQRENILLENEKLKSENLQATYSTLINQMNPHFFFNSLNSLSMLVREKHNTEALTYIDRLSDTFRYILQNGATGMITLSEELKFTEAYNYLLEIRYEGKLFVNFNVDKAYMDWTLPSLTLQPLLENAVKHNSITRSEPLLVEINSDENNNIIVSNTLNPKMDEGEGTGIGLSNLSERYRLLTGRDISVVRDDMKFTIILPLTPPEECKSLS